MTFVLVDLSRLFCFGSLAENRLFWFGSLVVLDMVCGYVLLFLIDLRIENR